jgi:HAE1 family hydrophobic/amphiphilic exporter-1
MGKKPYDAAMIGTEEIGLAVLATTLSIVAVFLPIGFMEGIIGKFFHEFGITIVAAVLISMFVSFTLDPMLSSVWHDPSIHMTGDQLKDPKTSTHLYDRTIGRVTHWFNLQTDRMAEKYQSMLAWALAHKKSTLSLAVGIFITSVLMVPLLGTEFVPKGDYSETTLNFQTPVGTSLEATSLKAKQVEQIVREFPEVKYTLTGMNTPNAQGKNNASIYIRLVDRKLRQRSVEDISVLLRQRLSQVAGITVTHVGTLDSVGGNKQIEFSLQGPDQRELERLTLKILEQVRTIPGLVDLDSSVKPNKPSIAIQLKRESASEMGLIVAPVSGSLRTLVAGQTVGNWRAPDDQTYDVNVRLAPEFRNSPQDLERIPFSLPSADGSTKTVRLGQIASVEETSGSNQINRRDLMREVSINANASRRSAGEISNDIRKILEASAWPPGYRYQFGGSTKSMNESFQYALTALMMAVIFIYMILGSQFKSFLQPLALMTSLPLTLIGVVLALMTFRSALSMFSVIGVVMLMGLVTKNAILLVDFTIRAREGSVSDTGETVPGLSRNEALLMAAKVRLRPILMTTLAMIFGMMPLAFAITEGSEQRAPMGQAVIGGVITSSLLTLVVVPVVYCYMDDLGEYLKRLWHGKPKSSH